MKEYIAQCVVCETSKSETKRYPYGIAFVETDFKRVRLMVCNLCWRQHKDKFEGLI